MAYASWSVVFGEQPSAAKWNILGTNDASFHDATGIDVDVLHWSQHLYGLIRNRQGGTTGDATWATTGTSNTATDAKDLFMQAGATVGNAGSDVTVTFPSAFNQVPLVFLASGVTSANANPILASVSASQFTFRAIDSGGTQRAENVFWLAIGQ